MTPEAIQAWNDALDAAAQIVKAQNGDDWISREILGMKHEVDEPVNPYASGIRRV